MFLRISLIPRPVLQGRPRPADWDSLAPSRSAVKCNEAPGAPHKAPQDERSNRSGVRRVASLDQEASSCPLRPTRASAPSRARAPSAHEGRTQVDRSPRKLWRGQSVGHPAHRRTATQRRRRPSGEPRAHHVQAPHTRPTDPNASRAAPQIGINLAARGVHVVHASTPPAYD